MGNYLRRCLPGRDIKPTNRPVVPNHTVDDSLKITQKAHPNYGYASNYIKTTRYTIITFLPKNLFEQFHRFANIYFIFVVALNWIPEVQAFAKEVAALPVLFVLLVTALKDAYEDFRRYRSDKKVNHNTCRIYSVAEERYAKKEWAFIYPGDFVHLSCNEIIPADILFIRSSDPQGICHIETSNIDGESNLKQRQILTGIEGTSDAEYKPTQFKYTVNVEQPNTEIYGFKGHISVGDDHIPLNSNNLLLRGCILRNTDYIEGMVVYAGDQCVCSRFGADIDNMFLLSGFIIACRETKAMLNNRGPRYKISKLETKINRDVIWCVILLLFLCFFCAIGSGIWLADYNNLTENTNLVPFIAFGDLDQYSPLYQGFLVFWTYIIIFQTVIPLPLYVSMELVKLGQIYFITQDIELYDEESDKPMECRALNITEDLGQIEYIFSDKTGTLTENKMEFKACTVGGVDYPHLPNDNDFDSRSDVDSHLSTTGASRASSIQDNLSLEDSLQRELSVMSLRSLDSVEPIIPNHVKQVQEFFLLMAVCNTVVVSYVHEDAMDDSGYIADDQLAQNGTGNANPSDTPLKDQLAKMKNSHGTPSSLKSRSMQSLSASEYDMSEGSVAGSSFLSITSSSRMHYEAESPDELALVKAASSYGCKLMKRSPDKVTVRLPNERDEVEMEVLNILHFDANRKRMSVIVRHPITHNITLFTKGADSAIMGVLNPRYYEGEEEKAEIKKTMEYLDAYAMRGLRTLCMAKKPLSEEEYKKWEAKHKVAETSMDNREELLSDSALEIERDLELLGATGIEDKLQDGVPRTISNLRQAGMKVWVLTGDKQETAIQIAHACHLFSQDQEKIIINATSKEETLSKLKEAIEKLKQDRQEQQETTGLFGSMISLITRSMTSLRSYNTDNQQKNYALVINGSTLTFATDPDLERYFLTLSIHCQSVVCCRATPIQKATVVKLVRDNLKKMTLAIGDGANDVSMIQTADIGIGISGQEGMQAVMSSDFAIARFKFLERLLLVHGHWNHVRLSMFTSIMFYKSLISVLSLFWFQLFSGFSGSLMIDSLYLTMQHVAFTSVPPLINGVFDKDLSAETLHADPTLYKPGQRGEMYTHWTFLIVLIDSLYQSLMIYFIPHLAYVREDVGIWEFGTTVDVCMILVILLHICIETNSWVWLQWAAIVFSFVIFWSFLLITNAIFFTFDHPSNPYWVMENTISTAIHSLVVIITVFLALLPRLIGRCIQNTMYPNEIAMARQREKLQEEEYESDEAEMNRSEELEGGRGVENSQYHSTNMTTHFMGRPDLAGASGMDGQVPADYQHQPHLYQKHSQTRSTFIPHKKALSRESMDEERRQAKDKKYPEVPLSEPVVRQRGRSASSSVDESVIT